MCTEHKHLWGQEGESLDCCSDSNVSITPSVTQIENKVVAEIPEWATDEEVISFTDKVKDAFVSIFK